MSTPEAEQTSGKSKDHPLELADYHQALGDEHSESGHQRACQRRSRSVSNDEGQGKRGEGDFPRLRPRIDPTYTSRAVCNVQIHWNPPSRPDRHHGILLALLDRHKDDLHMAYVDESPYA